MAKVNEKKIHIYKYDYPEQRILAEGLVRGDQVLISKILHISLSHVNDIMRGRRKMTDEVRELVEKLSKINRERFALLNN